MKIINNNNLDIPEFKISEVKNIDLQTQLCPEHSLFSARFKINIFINSNIVFL
jgi:hypothetical protein